ncbi:hypothetical protein B0H16DRAFT_1432905 [Mycena metata]|uniref:Uncharacterized protein n=1 Tax=Mycena metata TaxID=1033252 RepID=A0AAD7HGE0_9AGAR|nr:hypothetical protein B0H16DRAFT_1432905 [Mycena metata]
MAFTFIEVSFPESHDPGMLTPTAALPPSPMTDTSLAPRLEITGPDSERSFNTLYRSISGADAEETHNAQEKFNKLSDRAMDLREKISGVQSSALYEDVMAVRDADPGHLVSKSVTAVSKFAENSAVIMKGLDAVKQVHPFIGVVVIAFQAAIELELTRRENDKKIIALKTEMMEMMEILLDLKNIKDARKIDPDGTTLEGRMQRIAKKAEENIRNCSATCEAYMKKKFIVKLFDGSRWEKRLASFSDIFWQQKSEFSLALSIHTAQGVDNVQETLVGIETSVKTGTDSATMLLLFRQLESPLEGKLRKWIEDKGGAKVVSKDEKLFKELQSKMKEIKDATPNRDKSETTEALMLHVRKEMAETLERCLTRDRQQFDRKFDAVQTKLEEMKNTVRHSTDRVIKAVTSGPHDRIRDIDLYNVWKEMGWRGNVKARHFVVAIQDYFLQKYSNEDQQQINNAIWDAADGMSRAPSPAPSIDTVATDESNARVVVTRVLAERAAQHELEDRWAVNYITLARVRCILDAFDHDGSGWISVLEANLFTSSRPENFTVVKWIAFWAAGFTSLCARYAKAIVNVRAFMVSLSADVLPSNRARVDKYMCSRSLEIFDFIVRAVLPDSDEDEALMSHFTDYVASEEVRLTDALDHFGWNIDEQNTLQLIAGTSRIERHILPLIYLVLSRHAQIVQLACKLPLNDRELWDAECSVNTLADAIRLRIRTFENQFRTHSLDPAREFEAAYDGMFKIAYLSLKDDRSMENWEYPETYYTPQSEKEPDEKILKYKSIELGVPSSMYRDGSQDDGVPSHPFDGLWTGTYSYGAILTAGPQDGLVSTHLHFLDEEQRSFAGSGKDSIGFFEISGDLTQSDSASEKHVWFTKEYELLEGGEKNVWSYLGTVSVDDSGRMTVMSGNWGPWVDNPSKFVAYGAFQMDRTPVIVARHRPSNAEFETNPVWARWKLVLNVVEEQVQRKLSSWSYYRKRRDDRRKFIDATLHIADPMMYGRSWANDDYSTFRGYLNTFNELRLRLRPEDVQFYDWLAQVQLEQECFHPQVNKFCDSCEEQIVGARYRCLDCIRRNDGVNFCETCKDKSIFIADENLDHKPTTHVLLKTLRVVYPWREAVIVRWGGEERKNATEIFSRAKKYLDSESDKNKAGEEARAANEEPGDKDEEVVIPTCVYCEERVSRPCWFCVECSYDFFICNICEGKQVEMAKGKSNSTSTDGAVEDLAHKWHHVLVEIKEVVPQPPRIDLDMRLTMLEQKFAAHESAMRQKLDSVEALLNKLIAKMD